MAIVDVAGDEYPVFATLMRGVPILTAAKLKAPSAPVVSRSVIAPAPVVVSVTIALSMTAPVESLSFTTPLIDAAWIDHTYSAIIDKNMLIFLNIRNLLIDVILNSDF
jgi:hypothetical protein